MSKYIVNQPATNFSATLKQGSQPAHWSGKPVRVVGVFIEVPFKKDDKGNEIPKENQPYYDIAAYCSDGSRRILRIKVKELTTSQLEKARFQYGLLKDLVDNQQEAIFAVAGNFSVTHWFCDFTTDFEEVSGNVVVA